MLDGIYTCPGTWACILLIVVTKIVQKKKHKGGKGYVAHGLREVIIEVASTLYDLS